MKGKKDVANGQRVSREGYWNGEVNSSFSSSLDQADIFDCRYIIASRPGQSLWYQSKVLLAWLTQNSQ